MSVADEIEKLNALRQSGAISDEEFQRAKESLLEQQKFAGEPSGFGNALESISADENMWAMFLHLSQFCGYIVPLAGLIVPIVLWQVKKDESDFINRHGIIVVNWIITVLILAVVFSLLIFIVIGIPLLIVLAILGIVFPIIGGIKANNGEVWPYPFSIKFFFYED